MIDPGWGIVIVIGIFCTGLYSIANGRLGKKVDRDTCHLHVTHMTEKIEDIKEDTRDIRDMIKNGKH